MKGILNMKYDKAFDFEEFGYRTMHETGDLERAKEICALRIHEYERDLQPTIDDLVRQTQALKHRDAALHTRLYDRPIPVNDAAMLVRLTGTLTILVLAVLTLVASLAGNVTMFLLFGFALPVMVILGLGATALPLVIGHLAYEKIVAANKTLQTLLIAGAAALCFVALLQFGQARRSAIDRAAAADTTNSFVDDAVPTASAREEPGSQGSETKARQTLGGAMFTLLIAADLMLGLLAGLLSRLRADEDYAAWRQLKKIRKDLQTMEKLMSELIASIEIAKMRCMAGILRAENELRRHRRPPYYRALAMLIVAMCFPFVSPFARAQAIARYEGILIDTSASIAQEGNNKLFQQYLFAAKRVLQTEPGGSRVWVAAISTNSFRGTDDIVKGWTPEAHGVFADDLIRARRQLVASFEAKSAQMSAGAQGTDIIGGLWHMKALFESQAHHGGGQTEKTIWIFSDMVNETDEFRMPELIGLGADRMLERVSTKGLVVPLGGYKIHISGAAPHDLRPQNWLIIKKFWEMYFRATGAELITYSTECTGERE